MAKRLLSLLTVSAALCFLSGLARADEMSIMLVNKLIEKGVLTPDEGKTLISEAEKEMAMKEAAEKKIAAQELADKKQAIPEWTQKIKMKGDVRFRTQSDWNKNNGRSNVRIRQRVRARVGVEAKVNDQISAGVRLASGNDNRANSTNQTLEDNFSKKAVWFDAFYVLWTPKLSKDMGSAKVWGGKFVNPFNVSEALWDSDINPEGMVAQYSSPVFFESSYPTYFYGNGGYLWLDESATWEADPLCWVGQFGFNSLLNEEWGTTLDASIGYYDFANMLNKNIGLRQFTNDGWKFQNLDLILQLDNKKFMDLALPWGLYTDFNDNTASLAEVAYVLGGYLGTKKVSKEREWKVWGDWRYLDRDSVPDFLPDSDCPGFKTNGIPADGATNCKAISVGLQYGLLTDTVLSLKYYYSMPIEVVKSGNYENSPAQLFEADVNIKF